VAEQSAAPFCFAIGAMRREWLQTATDAIRRHDHRNILAGAVAGLGAALAIGTMAALIGGHVVATLAGLATMQPWAAAAAVRMAVLATYVTGTFHAPAGINPLLVVSQNLPWSFSIAPLLAGAPLLTAFGFARHRWVRRGPWPQRWL
jgi:CBS-domain-containing membrane protein